MDCFNGICSTYLALTQLLVVSLSRGGRGAGAGRAAVAMGRGLHSRGNAQASPPRAGAHMLTSTQTRPCPGGHGDHVGPRTPWAGAAGEE